MLSVFILIIEIAILHTIKSMEIISINNVVASLLIFAFSMSFIVSVQNNVELQKYANQLIAGYSFRILLLYFDLFGKRILVLPQSGADSAMFYDASKNWALYGIESKRGFFVYLMRLLFSFIGVNRLYSQFLLMLFSIGAILVFIHIIEKLNTGEKIKKQAVWILCLLPNFALLSSLFLRESIVTFIITLSLYYLLEWMRNGRIAVFFVSIMISLLGCLFHSGCIGITLGYVVCALLYDTEKQIIHTSFSGILVAITVALVIGSLYLNYGDILLSKFLKVETLQDIANTRGGAGSSYVQYVGDSSNAFSMIIYTMPRIVYFLFSPFPWQWRGQSDIIAFFFSGMYYLLTIKNAIGYLCSHEQKNREIVICMLMVAFFCTFIFAWGVSNTGTASRHRDKMICLYNIIYTLSTTATLSLNDYKESVIANCNQKKYIYH